MAKIKNHLGTGERNNSTGKWELSCPDCTWTAKADDAIDSHTKITNHHLAEAKKNQKPSGGVL